jgi:hypothetical protein
LRDCARNERAHGERYVQGFHPATEASETGDLSINRSAADAKPSVGSLRPLAPKLTANHAFSVMAGLVPAIHVFNALPGLKTWMPATSAGMTAERVIQSK